MLCIKSPEGSVPTGKPITELPRRQFDLYVVNLEAPSLSYEIQLIKQTKRTKQN